MAIKDKLKGILFGEDSQEQIPENINTAEEKALLKIINDNQSNAETARGATYNDTDNLLTRSGIELIWDDEYKMFKGLQWDTSFAKRPANIRKIRPNSVDNFILPAIMNQRANICASTPEVSIEPVELDETDGDDDESVSDKLTYASRFNDSRNNFRSTWKKMVQQFLSYGPVIGGVVWDPEWIGGTGPDRWIGDVRIFNINRKEIYFDPAIIDLEERMQECGYINRKIRKKLAYFKDMWPDKGGKVLNENNEDKEQYEGSDPQQAYLIESWHRGRPQYIPPERKAELLERAEQAEEDGDPYRAQDLRDMAEGNIDGIHRSYSTKDVFFEYMPYVYDHGLYPFAYKVCYYDENSPHGFGEIRNVMIPQIMHNKADEIEIEAMSREGLGGKLYNRGAISSKQKDDILRNYGKGGMWFEVDNVHGIEDREGVKTPASLVGYKEHKQRMVETITQNTPIQQGMSPGANMPFRAIAELGARSDVKTNDKAEILEDFLVELNRLRIALFAQFYTEERYYRIKGPDNKTYSGRFSNKDMMKQWTREDAGTDEEGNPTEPKQETFIPEFDVTVRIMDEKPTDRNYYTSTAADLFKAQAMDMESLWYTLEEGKFPQAKEVIERLSATNEAVGMVKALEGVPPEAKAQFMQAQQELLQQFLGSLQGGQMAQPGMQPGMEQPQQGQQMPSQQDMNAFLESLPPEIFKMIEQLLGQLPPEKQDSIIAEIMMMNEDQIARFVQDMMERMGGVLV